MPIPAAIQNLESFDESINMLVVAESGFGKTVLAGTADQRKNKGPKALFLATEHGTISAARKGSTADVWPIKNFRDLAEAYSYFNEGSGCQDYQWLLLDSITEMQKLSMDNALRTAVTQSKGTRDPDVPAIQDYLKVQQQTLNFLRRFNELPINCLYTALPYRLEDAEGNPYFLPALDGKQGGIAQQAMGYMHVVCHGIRKQIKNGEKTVMVRRFYFQSVGPYRAKDRYGVFGRYQDNLTMPRVEELIGQKPKITVTQVKESDNGQKELAVAEVTKLKEETKEKQSESSKIAAKFSDDNKEEIVEAVVVEEVDEY